MLYVSLEDSEPFGQRQALIAAAQAGDADAQATLGDVLRVGDEFTDQDFEEAIRWYRRAADQGHAGALNNLGAMYAHGWGVPQDAAKAATWYREAAELGLVTAQANLGFSFLHGDGVQRDEREAVRWLFKAAEQGHPQATGELATMFRFGNGVERNIVTAARLYVKAGTAGDGVSTGNLMEYRDEIEKEALKGSLRAALVLATMYEDGHGVERNTAIAYAWLLVGRRFGSRDDDQPVRDELYDRDLALYTELSSDLKAEAYRWVAIMCASRDEP